MTYYAVFSPRNFANETTVTEFASAADARELDAGFPQPYRAKYISKYKIERARGVTTDARPDAAIGSYTFLELE